MTLTELLEEARYDALRNRIEPNYCYLGPMRWREWRDWVAGETAKGGLYNFPLVESAPELFCGMRVEAGRLPGVTVQAEPMVVFSAGAFAPPWAH